MSRMIKFALPAVAALAAAPLAMAETVVVKETAKTETVAADGATAAVVTAEAVQVDMANIVMADSVIGADVRAVDVDDATWGTEYYVDAYPENADLDDIGEVEDIALGADGQIKGLIVDVGGFLGMGEHRVLLAQDQYRVFRQDGWGDDYKVVSRLTKEQLEAMPKFSVDD